MKKLLLFIALIAFIVEVNAQMQIRTQFTAPNFVYVGGTTADTLKQKDTLIWSIRMNGNATQRIEGRMYIKKVTGTISDTTYFYGSFDGTTKDAAIDSVFCSNVSTGYKELTSSRWTTFAYPYLLIWNWKKGGSTLASVRKFEFNARNAH